MTDHRLSAGTDVAEMALFDTEAIPQSRPLNEKGLDDLADVFLRRNPVFYEQAPELLTRFVLKLERALQLLGGDELRLEEHVPEQHLTNANSFWPCHG